MAAQLDSWSVWFYSSAVVIAALIQLAWLYYAGTLQSVQTQDGATHPKNCTTY